MDRRLIVMRHAKSSWSSGAVSDHERPLNDRGRRDAPRVAEHLVQIGWQPAAILSSDAKRTQETYEGMSGSFPEQVPAQFTHSLYHAGYSSVLDEAPGVPDDVSCLLVLGHNPGWEDMVHVLSGEYVLLKTANAALLQGVGESWRDALAMRGSWKLVDIVRSRDL